MRQIVGKAYTELGKELYEAQQRLSKNGYGCFSEWCKHIGFNNVQANRLIQRYSMITKCNERTQELLEDMPVTLSYEIAKPSSESTPAKAQAKSEVLAGDIATLKEYRERIKELERKAEQAEKQEITLLIALTSFLSLENRLYAVIYKPIFNSLYDCIRATLNARNCGVRRDLKGGAIPLHIQSL